MRPTRSWSRPAIWVMGLVLLFTIPPVAASQTQVEPGFNLFSPDQDVEIGRESARQVETQFPVMQDREITRYVDRLGARLVESTPGYDFPYQFDVVDVADVNAFALPGGFMYLNRGLLMAAPNEPELAAVMAHEIAHVALRHGTNQASKAYLGQAGLSLLGGLIGDGDTTSDIIGAVGGFGLNALFLKFSRDDEEEADIVGAQILARSGYDPMAMAHMFEAMRARAEDSGAGDIPTFFSSHPPYDDRMENVRAEADMLEHREQRRLVGDLGSVQAELASMREPRSMEHYLQEGGVADDRRPSEPRREERAERSRTRDLRIEAPSSEWNEYRQDDGYFSLRHPANWQVYEAGSGFGVSIVPRGGMLELADGRNEIVYGVILKHFTPHDVREQDRRWGRGFASDSDWRRERAGTWLERASNQLVDAIVDSNPHLHRVSGSASALELDRARAHGVTLSGHNPVTGREERVRVVTRETTGDGHLVYALLIAPEESWNALSDVFDRMMRTLEIDDRSVHRPEAH